MATATERESWVNWLAGYDAGKLFDSIIANCQGAESTVIVSAMSAWPA